MSLQGFSSRLTYVHVGVGWGCNERGLKGGREKVLTAVGRGVDVEGRVLHPRGYGHVLLHEGRYLAPQDARVARQYVGVPHLDLVLLSHNWGKKIVKIFSFVVKRLFVRSLQLYEAIEWCLKLKNKYYIIRNQKFFSNFQCNSTYVLYFFRKKIS